jgi:hypothetical protein
MKTHGEWTYSSTTADFDTRWRWGVSYMPQLLYSWGRSPSNTHWIGGYMGPLGGLDTVKWIKISCPCQEMNPGHPAHSLSLYQLNYSSSFAIYKVKQVSKHVLSCVKFGVFTAVTIKSSILWDITPCSLVKGSQCFRWTYCLHHQSQRARQHEAGLLSASCWSDDFHQNTQHYNPEDRILHVLFCLVTFAIILLKFVTASTYL